MYSETQQARPRSTELSENQSDGPVAQIVVARLAEAALLGADTSSLFALATDLITEALDVELLAFLHQRSPGEPLILETGRGWGSHVVFGESCIPPGQGSQAGYTLSVGEPVEVDELATETRFEIPSLYYEQGVVSGMSVVIPGEDHPYGVLEVWAGERRRFSADHRHLLECAAIVLGGAWVNGLARLRSEREAASRERRVQYHAALAKCAQSLLASGGEDRLDRAIDALLSATSASCVFVERSLANAEGGSSARRVAESVAPGTPGHGETDARRAAAAGGITAPILVDGDWAGTIGLAESETEREWTDEDRSLVTAAATMIGAYWERDGARDALVEMVRSKNQFLASVSHELRAPIATVVGTSEILRDGTVDLSDEERAGLLDMVVSEGTDLVNIVNDLLAAAKADSGTLTVSRVSVSLRAQVAQVLEGIHQDNGARIEITGESEQGIGDPGRVRQIVRNLVSNAQRYGGDTIRVELSAENGSAMLRICDDGSGVPEETRDRIFEPYASAHGSDAPSGSIGLGLAVSRELARLMDGDLTYRYQDGESVFELSLPLAG